MYKRIATAIFLIALSTFVSLAASPVTIKGTHHINDVQSGTRTYILESVDGKTTTQKVTKPVNEPFSFVLNFSEPGDYKYKAYEEPMESKDLEQDKTVYEILVSVTRTTEPVFVIKGPNGKVDEMTFADKYTPHKKDVPADPEEDQTGSIGVKTGDETNIAIYVITLGAALLLLIALVWQKKKRR